jgi:hypothetical protein
MRELNRENFSTVMHAFLKKHGLEIPRIAGSRYLFRNRAQTPCSRLNLGL